MQDSDKTKEQLIGELNKIRRKMAELQATEAKPLSTITASYKHESLYGEIVGKTSEAIFIAQDGLIKFKNQAFLELTGYSNDECLSSDSFLDFVHPDDREMLSRYHANRLQGDTTPYHYDFRIIHKDGKVKWGEMNSSLIMWEGMPAALCFIADITERRLAEEALKQSEKQLRAVIYGSPIPQFMIDRDHRVVYWNHALESISGVPSDKVIGTREHWKAFYIKPRPTMADLLVDGESDLVPDWYVGKYRKSKLIADAYEATDFFPTLGNDGKWLSFTVAAIRNLEGNVIGAVETLEDITEQKRAEEELFKSKEELEARVAERTAELLEAYEELESELEERCRVEDALRQSEVKFRTVAEHTYDWEYWIAPDGGFKYVSPSCERITGYSSDEFVNNPTLLSEIIHPQDKSNTCDPLDMTDSRGLVSVDFRIITRNGDIRWIAHVCQPIFDDEGRLLGRRASNRDITKRRLAEEELRNSEEKYRQIFDNSPLGIFHFNQNGTITACNDTFVQIIGSSREKLIGLNMVDDLKDDQLVAVVKRSLSGKVSHYEGEYASVTANKITPVKVDFSPLLGEGGVGIGGIGIAEDITERKKADDALRESEEKYRMVVERAGEGIIVAQNGILHVRKSQNTGNMWIRRAGIT